MIRLIGSTFVAAGAAFLGFHAAGRLKRQVRALEELGMGLLLLEQELELSAPELDVLMQRLSMRSRGAAKRLFARYAKALAQMDSGTAGQLWECSVSQLEDLTPEGKQCLTPLGEVLGRYDSREQRICTAAVRARLEELREQTQKECALRCRTCQTIALSGGAFLIVLLL